MYSIYVLICKYLNVNKNLRIFAKITQWNGSTLLKMFGNNNSKHGPALNIRKHENVVFKVYFLQ